MTKASAQRPRAQTSAFIEHLLELCSSLGAVRVRAMFGGYGVYAGERMFGLVDEDVLYLKVYDGNRARFDALSLPPFVYPSKKGPMEMTGWRRAPADCFDDADVMCDWARSALAAPNKKTAKKKIPPAAKKSSPSKAAKKKKAR